MAAPWEEFRFTLNGQQVAVSALPGHSTLLDFVRSRGLTGAKEGCAEGECGACAMLLACHDPAAGPAWRAINSCLVPLAAMAGREVVSVEGLTDPNQRKPLLTQVQTALAAAGASQCGYCTPGFVISLFAAQHGPASEPVSVHSLGGNLCRCTGYRPIHDALMVLPPAPAGPFRERLTRPVPAPAPLAYQSAQDRFSRPATLAEALDLAHEDPAALFLSGNTDLGVVANLRGERFSHLIHLELVPELRVFRDEPCFTEIGAALTLTEIAGLWRGAPAVFREWLPLFASLLIRNRATLGGNLATASPIGDAAPLLLALGAEIEIASRLHSRLLPLASFFRAYRRTALEPGEIIRSLRIPKPFPAAARFFKVARRGMDDISTVAAAFAAGPWGLRGALGGVAATPVVFEAPGAAALQDTLRATLKPMSDHRGSAAYRLAMAISLVDKFEAGLEAAA